MAKRKRLAPAGLIGGAPETGSIGPLETKLGPPIAQVAGQTASEAALREMADEISSARAEGRMVQEVALDAIDDLHLARDRIVADETDLHALETSIAARGQQAPLDVVDLGLGAAPMRYGLISGWRRLTVLKRLYSRTNDARFAVARVVLRQPERAADAYLSMVEENELRVGLSYYERAQVAARAADMGVFESSASAVAGLFPTASKAKRSKINAFVRIYRILGPVLTYPDRIPERLGLRVAKALDAGQGPNLYAALNAVDPISDPEAEMACLADLLTDKKDSKEPTIVENLTFLCGVTLVPSKDALKLSGVGVTEALRQDLEAWLASRPASEGD